MSSPDGQERKQKNEMKWIRGFLVTPIWRKLAQWQYDQILLALSLLYFFLKMCCTINQIIIGWLQYLDSSTKSKLFFVDEDGANILSLRHVYTHVLVCIHKSKDSLAKWYFEKGELLCFFTIWSVSTVDVREPCCLFSIIPFLYPNGELKTWISFMTRCSSTNNKIESVF